MMDLFWGLELANPDLDNLNNLAFMIEILLCILVDYFFSSLFFLVF